MYDPEVTAAAAPSPYFSYGAHVYDARSGQPVGRTSLTESEQLVRGIHALSGGARYFAFARITRASRQHVTEISVVDCSTGQPIQVFTIPRGFVNK